MATIRQIYLPQSIFKYFTSEEFKLELYRTFKGKEPTEQWAVDRVYNSIKFPLFYHIKYILYVSHYRKYEYIPISTVTLKKMFGNKYQAVRKILLDYFNGHVFTSKLGVESYCADPKVGFCKKYIYNPDPTYRLEKKVAIPVSELERKKIMEIFHQTGSTKVIKDIEERMALIQFKESAPKELKKKVKEGIEEGMKSKKTDGRFYGIGTAIKSNERQHVLMPNNDGELESIAENDFTSFHPRILAKVVYQMRDFVSKELQMEQWKWYAINQGYGDIYKYIACKVYNKEVNDINKIDRDTCKTAFVSIMNTNYSTNGTITDDFQWEVAEALHKELPLYTDVILQIDSIEDVKKCLPKWKYNKFKDHRSLTYRVLSHIEAKIMISVLERVMNRWENVGFLWTHDCCYAPESHADDIREIMNQEFEKYTV